jgi:hypothetical protein
MKWYDHPGPIALSAYSKLSDEEAETLRRSAPMTLTDDEVARIQSERDELLDGGGPSNRVAMSTSGKQPYEVWRRPRTPAGQEALTSQIEILVGLARGFEQADPANIAGARVRATPDEKLQPAAELLKALNGELMALLNSLGAKAGSVSSDTPHYEPPKGSRDKQPGHGRGRPAYQHPDAQYRGHNPQASMSQVSDSAAKVEQITLAAERQAIRDGRRAPLAPESVRRIQTEMDRLLGS